MQNILREIQGIQNLGLGDTEQNPVSSTFSRPRLIAHYRGTELGTHIWGRGGGERTFVTKQPRKDASISQTILSHAAFDINRFVRNFYKYLQVLLQADLINLTIVGKPANKIQVIFSLW